RDYLYRFLTGPKVSWAWLGRDYNKIGHTYGRFTLGLRMGRAINYYYVNITFYPVNFIMQAPAGYLREFYGGKAFPEFFFPYLMPFCKTALRVNIYSGNPFAHLRESDRKMRRYSGFSCPTLLLRYGN